MKNNTNCEQSYLSIPSILLGRKILFICKCRSSNSRCMAFYCLYKEHLSKTSILFVHWIKCICQKKLLICKCLSSDSCCMAFHCPPQFQTMAKLLQQQQCWQQYIPWGCPLSFCNLYLYFVILFGNALLERYSSWDVSTFIL